MMKDKLKEILSRKVPKQAVPYCFELWEKYPFSFVVSRKRLSKLGDYRFNPRDQSHTVTVNGDLNTYQFLITYVHEVAHRIVHKSRSRQLPHGVEWKNKFRELMLPLLSTDFFPDDVLRLLAKHMKNPKASTSADPALVKVLSNYDLLPSKMPTLDEVAIGEEFFLRKRKFKKLETKRTRALCLDMKNGKRYLISEVAEVELEGKPVSRPPSEKSQTSTASNQKSKKVNPTADNQMHLFE